MPNQQNAPAPVEESETVAAFVNAAAADPDLTAALPGGIKSGEVVSGVIVGTSGATLSPYATIECEQGPRANEFMIPAVPGQGYHDYRKITLCIYGLKAACELAYGHARRVFEWQPKIPASNSGNTTKPMSMPQGSTAVLKRVMPIQGSGRFEQQKQRVQGNPIWKGTQEYEVWTVRTIP